VTFEELEAFWSSNKAKICKNVFPSWMEAMENSNKNSDDPDSDNSVDEADLIPVTAALAQHWFTTDLNKDGFTTQEEMQQIFSLVDGMDGTVDGKIQRATYEAVSNESLLKVCYESAIM